MTTSSATRFVEPVSRPRRRNDDLINDVADAVVSEHVVGSEGRLLHGDATSSRE